MPASIDRKRELREPLAQTTEGLAALTPRKVAETPVSSGVQVHVS